MDLAVFVSPAPHISWVTGILGIINMITAVILGIQVFVHGAKIQLPKEPTYTLPDSAIPETWAQLCEKAQRVIEEMLVLLPDKIRYEAKNIPCLYEERAEKESAGYRTLGLYHNFVPGRKSESMGPITLYLRTIEEVCAEKGEDFDAKLASVYLHELGHHFGWDEVDLAREGLPSGRPPGK